MTKNNPVRPTPHCKRHFLLLGAILILFLPGRNLIAQQSNCTNLNFEQGDFSNWEAYSWRNSTSVTSINTEPELGLVDRRHEIMSDQNAYDPNTNYGLKIIPPGHDFVARLGDGWDNDEDQAPRCWHQSIRYDIDVEEENALLLLKYALVLEWADPDHSWHEDDEQPRGVFTIYDEQGDTIDNCANFDVHGTNDEMDGFTKWVLTGGSRDKTIQWRDWTTVGVDLSDFIGQSITIEFMAADCRGQGHMGYAYFTASCHPLRININYCERDTVAILSAPFGFTNYIWKDTKGDTIGTGNSLEVVNPEEGTLYYCEMLSSTGCEVSLEAIIERYKPEAHFTITDIDCANRTVSLANQSSTSEGYLDYDWNFGDGSTSDDFEPKHTFSTLDQRNISLIITNSPSTCKDTFTVELTFPEIPQPEITGDTITCEEEPLNLGVSGAESYEWSTGSVEAFITVEADDNTFWVIGKSEEDCPSDTVFHSIRKYPEWELITSPDTILCPGETTLVEASGAQSYMWNTGEITNSLFTTAPDTLIVNATNTDGCIKEDTIVIAVAPIPNALFDISSRKINKKESMVTVSLPQEGSTNYNWNMGDETEASGNIVEHEYSVEEDVEDQYYNVLLDAVNEYGCNNKSADIVNVLPYVPNIFTPNNDGKNDLFMKGTEIELFDRFGKVIYKGSDGWDGNYNGQPADPDTYFYSLVVRIMTPGGYWKLESLKGYITLVR